MNGVDIRLAGSIRGKSIFFFLLAAFFVSHLAISTGESDEDLLKQTMTVPFTGVLDDKKQVEEAGDW